MQHAIETLRTIGSHCASGTALGNEEMHWLGEALHRFLTRQCPSLDHAAGVPAMRGGVPWWMEEAIRNRDSALRQLAATLCPEDTAHAKARTVHIACQRYAASTWRFDRYRDTAPTPHAGSPRALMWQAFRTAAVMPVSERHLRNILG